MLEALKGGDYADRTMLIRQNVFTPEFEIILNNPGNIETGQDKENTNRFTLYQGFDNQTNLVFFHGLFSNAAWSDATLGWSQTSLWIVDISTGKLIKRTGSLMPSAYFYISTNKEWFGTYHSKLFSTYNVNIGTETKNNLDLPDTCQVLALSNDGVFVISTCPEGEEDVISIVRLSDGKSKILIRSPQDPYSMLVGKSRTTFVGFANP
jgi:hypothetical protein